MKMKPDIKNGPNASESLLPLLESLKTETQGYKVPDGYFDSLNSRIADKIKNRETSSFLRTSVPVNRKPILWVSVSATMLVAVVLIFVIHANKETVIPALDEWTEINMAYDPSYAEEALMAESNIIESELMETDNRSIESVVLSDVNEPTDEEITEYLKTQELDTEILIEN